MKNKIIKIIKSRFMSNFLIAFGVLALISFITDNFTIFDKLFNG